ncbi:short-chain dehydrogenase [Pedobacter sp. BAL39]|uniref:SDR family NAD(P)-dependent oxidoreductase n=1 Tax=Pedobacter sp. BAL39 TaxID=391596 RepID=UPI0001559389|nr:SDR family oxidoreductase [Pedobacter sp. BAL39]EDM38824.1 short-chain dehydrogenase [Pedobacter sp. BAL39]
MNEYALVTGASKGIGREIALQLAGAGYQLLLTARSEEELAVLSALIKAKYKVQVSYLPCDLGAPGGASQVASWTKEQKLPLSILINNAGYGLFGAFDQLGLKDQQDMLHLNIEAVVSLTHQLLPLLKQQAQSYVLNLGSTASYQAVPSLAVYSATKAFILSYSRGLRYELKGSNISVTCLCPGPTATGFASRAGLDAFAELAEKFNMSPVDVAKAGLRAMFRKKAEVVPGFSNRVGALAASFLPKVLVERVAASLYKL